MKIKQLIKELQKHNPNDEAQIFIWEEGTTSTIKSVHTIDGQVELSTHEKENSETPRGYASILLRKKKL